MKECVTTFLLNCQSDTLTHTHTHTHSLLFPTWAILDCDGLGGFECGLVLFGILALLTIHNSGWGNNLFLFRHRACVLFAAVLCCVHEENTLSKKGKCNQAKRKEKGRSRSNVPNPT